MSESPALNAEYLKTNFHCNVYQFELTEVVRQANDSGILTNATEIRNMIRDENEDMPSFNLLKSLKIS